MNRKQTEGIEIVPENLLFEGKTYKYYIDVEMLVRSDGTFKPVALYWKRHRYRVDKITQICHTFSKAGGCGLRFTCRIWGESRNLFWERNRWFIESGVKADPTD